VWALVFSQRGRVKALAPLHLDSTTREHHDVIVRTTITLEPDIARMVDEEVHRSRRSFKQVVNDALRHGLLPGRRTQGRPFKVVAHHAMLKPGLDPGAFNRLADELEDAEVLTKAKRS
jgi:hypothetical protein